MSSIPNSGPSLPGGRAGASGLEQVNSWSRDVRFASGCVLMLFATTHFLNHAVGIFGIPAMEAMQLWRHGFWESKIGSVLLYGALIVHPVFALLRVAQRRTFRMPMREVLQIALGVAIPLLLIDHIVATRVQGTLFMQDESYHAVLRRLWPNLALSQSLLLLLVWTHGVIGLHFTFRSRDSYARWRDPFLLAAILVPLLALIGFAVAGREARLMALPPELSTAQQVDSFNLHVTWAKRAFFGLVGAFVLFVAIREVRARAVGAITVRFVGHGVRKVVPGFTLLEIFRRFGIPHAALCGGRARCATCRVLVLDGAADLPPPGPNEARLLRRISAGENVRLACQIRPKHDLQVQILLAARQRGAGPSGALDPDSGIARKGLTVMVADLRAFTALSERQLPRELLTLLNRFYDEMSQAIAAHGGRIEAIYGDGLMAVFGLDATPGRAASAAIAAAGDMLRAVEALNREYATALPLPLRIGIGIHGGQAIMGAVENESMGRREITVGETVMIASQLEAATRRLLSDIIVSAETVAATGRSFPGITSYKIAIKGRDKPMQVYGFGGVPEKVVPGKPEENAPRLKQVAKAGSDKTEADDNTG
ncbi:MAG TPA: adenylate/guanylate cyclase domain-containing protein [Bosea sp. (in: a-proteobacteria)]|jgi:adenylate cyclase|uniref:adenylate/guanylate cyclase domain-containing protein n=1 Tax=Bosea sp. (in: a-proteobacteria) TaxID=1871050 RepID=UPI002E10FE79|nr:adenylate/guanylate cyclase domain-containing protein [Bosea sp. (in: a-proteobacteria)]